MSTGDTDSAGFAMHGGEADTGRVHRPVDLAHLAHQTMGDRDLERDVLNLFVHQALGVRDRIADASVKERLFLLHGLKGSARAIGAFAVAGCADEIESSPNDVALLERLASLIEDVRDFAAAISR